MKNRCAIAALAALLWAAPSHARDNALEPPDLGRYLKWGPLRARPGLEITNFGYDDNILSSNIVQEADITATVSPKLDGLVLFGNRAFFEFKEMIQYTAYLENTQLNFWNHLGSGRVTFPLSRIGFFADYVANRIEQRPIDLEDIRVQRNERGLALGVILQPGWRTEIELSRGGTGFSYVDRDFVGTGQSISDRLDRDTSQIVMDVRYKVRGRTSLTLDSYVGAIDFQSLDSQGRTKDSRSWGAIPGFELGVGRRLTGTVRIGWSVINADDRTRPDFAEVVGDANLLYRPLGRLRINIGAKRLPGFSLYENAVYYVESQVSARGVYYLTRIFGVESGVSGGRLLFPDAQGEREDNLLRYDVGVRLRLAENTLGRRIEYSLRWGRYERTSTVPFFDRSQTTFGLNAILGF